MFAPDSPRLRLTWVTQAAIYVFQGALFTLLKDLGVVPTALCGHSVGEYAAMAAAGVFSWETGLDMVLTRGKLAGELERKFGQSGMAAVLGSWEKVEKYLSPEVYIMAENGPETVTIAGFEGPLRESLDALAAAGVESRPLPVSQAFHCPLAEPMIMPYEKYLEELQLKNLFTRLKTPLLSTVLGDYVDRNAFNPAGYLARQILKPVLFFQAILKANETIFLELGPTPTLTSYARLARKDAEFLFLQNPGSDLKRFMTTLGKLWTLGLAAPVNLDNLPNTPELLPPTPFNREQLHQKLAQSLAHEGEGPQLAMGMKKEDDLALEPSREMETIRESFTEEPSNAALRQSKGEAPFPSQPSLTPSNLDLAPSLALTDSYKESFNRATLADFQCQSFVEICRGQLSALSQRKAWERNRKR
jgi:myxalamid-type polyketide synthase MxaB